MEGSEKKENESAQSVSRPRPHVRIFGADVDSQDGNGWRERREGWKKEREAWRDERRKTWNEHGVCGGHHGGAFFGLLILFLGILLLLGTMGLIPHGFWHAVLPFWPALLILWGLDILIGRNGFLRFLIALLALFFFLGVVVYGLAKTASSLVKNLPPGVVNAAGNINPQNPIQ
jgi:hypothetical protein